MTQQISKNLPVAEPLAYAEADLNRRPPLVTIVAIISMCIACLSLLVNGLTLRSAIGSLREAINGPAKAQQMIALNARSQAQAVTRMKAEAQAEASRAPMRALTSQEIIQALSYINRQLAMRSKIAELTGPQRQTLTRLLSTNGQRWIDPNIPLGSVTPSFQVVRAQMDGDRSLVLVIDHGSDFDVGVMHIDSAGREQFSTPPGVRRLNMMIRGLNTGAQVRRYQQYYHDQYVAALISIILLGIYLLLPFPLLVGGIYVLLRKARGVRLHWIYVWVKLLVGFVVATSLIFSLFPTQAPLEIGLNTPWVLLGCYYPLALLFVLRGGTFRGGGGAGTVPGGFGSANFRPPLFTTFGTISIWIGILNLIVGGFFAFEAITNMSDATGRQDYSAACLASFAFTLDLLPPLLLLVGAWMLLRANSRGVLVHRIYSLLKIFTAIATGVAGFMVMLNSPGWFLAPIAVIPSVFWLIYPIALLIVLRRRHLQAYVAAAI